jgi:hypothetical protein
MHIKLILDFPKANLVKEVWLDLFEGQQWTRRLKCQFPRGYRYAVSRGREGGREGGFFPLLFFSNGFRRRRCLVASPQCVGPHRE